MESKRVLTLERKELLKSVSGILNGYECLSFESAIKDFPISISMFNNLSTYHLRFLNNKLLALKEL